MAKNESAPPSSKEEALAQIEKKYGPSAIMKMSDKPEMNIEVIPTGNIAIDLALGVGGFPKGRIAEIYGPESSGKSTLLLHVIASAQKAGGTVAFIDAEHALDPAYARALGVDVDNLYISQPDHGEQALDIVDKLVASGGFDLVVVDSVAALTPLAEIRGEMGDAHVGLHARMMSQAMRKVAANVNKTKTTLLFTNQIREKIGVMFGSPETTPGGRALKFYSSVRIDIRRISTTKTGDVATGNEVKIKVVKNKVAPPFREAVVELEYGEGFNNESALIDVAVSAGMVKKGGAWYTMPDGEQVQGKAAALVWLEENPQDAEDLRQKILEWAAG